MGKPHGPLHCSLSQDSYIVDLNCEPVTAVDTCSYFISGTHSRHSPVRAMYKALPSVSGTGQVKEDIPSLLKECSFVPVRGSTAIQISDFRASRDRVFKIIYSV